MDVTEIKALGRKVSNYDDTVWNGVRQIIIYRGLFEKFRQNRELAEMLLGTGDTILAECAVKDRIWGIGLNMRDNDRFDIKKWNGQNLLGFALMEVRKCLAKAPVKKSLEDRPTEFSGKLNLDGEYDWNK